MKNYKYVIELIQHRDLSNVNPSRRRDLEYLLAHALYQTGDYRRALDQVLFLLEHNETERLHLLLAMIYESLGQTNTARECYIKLITRYPKSDYTASAQIKSRILGRH